MLKGSMVGHNPSESSQEVPARRPRVESEMTSAGRDRRTDILRNAALLFSERGYEATTMRELAEAVGIRAPSIHHFFPTKHAILEEIMSEVLLKPLAAVLAVLENDDEPVTQIRDIMAVHVRAYHDQLPEMVVFTREDPIGADNGEFAERIRDLRRQFQDVWVAAIENGIRAGVFRDDLDPRMVSYAVVGMVNWMFRWYSPDGRLDPDEISHVFSEIVLGGIRR